MRLWNAFRGDGHRPCHAYRSVWAATEPVERDLLRDPDGTAWHIDRARFERRLRAVAAARGALLLAPARPEAIRHGDDGWRLSINNAGSHIDVRCRIVIDAGGRSSRVLANFGAQRHVEDRLVCRWARCQSAGIYPGIVHIEAEPDGWWYAAALPDGTGIIAFHTDADLPAARSDRAPPSLARRAAGLPMMGGLIERGAWASAATGVCAAHSAWLARASGRDWIAVGDAAVAFDPLASQGLFNALYTGLAAAQAADRHLAGDAAAMDDYAAELKPIRDTYRAHLAAWYGIERRFAERPFWRRRHAGGDAATTREATNDDGPSQFVDQRRDEVDLKL